jgi:hypothetical protein
MEVTMRLALICFLIVVAPLGNLASAQTCPRVISQWPEGPLQGVAVDGLRMYLAIGGEVMVLTMSDPAAPRVVGRVALGDSVTAIAAAGAYAYAGTLSTGLRVLDVRNSTAPVEIGSDAKPGMGAIRVLCIDGETVYFAGEDSQGEFDVHWPTQPRLDWGSSHGASVANDIIVHRDFAIWARSDGTLELSDGHTQRWTIQLPAECLSVVASGDFLYCGGVSGISVVWFNPPAEPDFYAMTPGPALDLAILDHDRLGAATGDGIALYDLSDPLIPVLDSETTLPGSASVTIFRSTVYVGDGPRGLHVVADIYDAPTHVASMAAAGDTVSVAPSDGFAYLANGADGLRVLRRSSSGTWETIAEVELPAPARIVAVDGHLAAVVDDDSVLWFFDVTVPESPRVYSWFAGLSDARDLVVAGNLVYVAGGLQGLHLIDLGDPAAPTEIGVLDTSSNFEALALANGLAFVADGVGLRIVDVADPVHPSEIASLDLLGQAYDVALSGNFAVVAQDEQGVAVVDVATPTDPELVATFYYPGATRVATSGELAIFSLGREGFGIFKLRDLDLPQEAVLSRTLGEALDLAVDDRALYVADGGGGMTVIQPWCLDQVEATAIEID